MALAAGTRLGPYEILAPAGAGGMGEVYRARDTRLERTVAVKVLPAHIADRPEVRQRFEREARAVSALNHPHICTLYDIGSQDGTDYLVMEFVEGESLAERLQRGALPTEQALRYAIQIADALDKAHRQGIVHRDLKPGNLMITAAGVKVLDFGLAKMQERAAMVSGGSLAQTLTTPLTTEGSLVGTLQYMAPEQLEGKEADARSDIFAFGAVFYEMLTGRRAFQGKSQAGLIVSIMEHEAPAVVPAGTAALDRVVRRCLAKNPEDRWQSARDLAFELQWAADKPAAAAPSFTVKRARQYVAWAAAGLLLLITAFFAAARLAERAPEQRSIRFEIPAPENTTFPTASGGQAAISPDGRRLAFIAQDSAGTRLWVRELDSFSARPLAGTEGARSPFWSPDSRHIGFAAQGKLKRIDVSGGPPQILCNSPGFGGGTWNQDDVIVFSPENASPLYRVSAAGGTPVAATSLATTRLAIFHWWPSFLPDGRHFLFYNRSAGGAENSIYVGVLGSKDAQMLLRADSHAVYAPDHKAGSGFLVFVRQRALMAVAFDPARLKLIGDAFPVLDAIGISVMNGYSNFSASPAGVLSYQPGDQVRAVDLAWFDRAGKQLEMIASGEIRHPRLSLDAKKLAFEQRDAQLPTTDIWVRELARAAASRMTFDPAFDILAGFSPDSTQIVFSSTRNGKGHLYRKAANGAGAEELLLESSTDLQPFDWSPDGRYVIYSSIDPMEYKSSLFVLPMTTGERKPVPYLQTPFAKLQAKFSPDSRFVAYASDESGRPEIYVQTFPESGGKWQISTSGGVQPAWRVDGKELYYLAADGKLMAVPVKTATAFEAGAPVSLFETSVSPAFSVFSKLNYAVSPDGKRFLLPARTQAAQVHPIRVVLNWTAALKK